MNHYYDLRVSGMGTHLQHIERAPVQKNFKKFGRGKIFDLIPLTNSLFRRRRRSGRAAAEKSSNDSQKR
jgi:hypothetical protein